MRSGVHLPHIGPWHDGETLWWFALAIEEMGYDSLWTSDHWNRATRTRPGATPLPPAVPWLEPVSWWESR